MMRRQLYSLADTDGRIARVAVEPPWQIEGPIALDKDRLLCRRADWASHFRDGGIRPATTLPSLQCQPKRPNQWSI